MYSMAPNFSTVMPNTATAIRDGVSDRCVVVYFCYVQQAHEFLRSVAKPACCPSYKVPIRILSMSSPRPFE